MQMLQWSKKRKRGIFNLKKTYTNIEEYLHAQNKLDTLKLITCGSVDDGKSTLLGRMLYEAQQIFSDQVDSLVNDSKRFGTQDGEIDFALLVDGLSAEREQGITIDVAYRFFATENRKFIVADSPGHEQYTRNMVTAASNADLAIILIDARNGILSQTKRHSFIADLLGIKHVLVAVNKMDLVDYDETIFEKIVSDYKQKVSSKVKFETTEFIPVSALNGDNILNKSSSMSWYQGETLISLLENTKNKKSNENNFMLPIQLVNRPNLDFRGFSGTVASGEINEGDEIRVSSSGAKANVNGIFLGDKKLKKASFGDAVTLTVNKEIDISRGDLITKSDIQQIESNAFLTNIIWFNEADCYQNRRLILKTANNLTGCEIINIKSKININTFEKKPANSLKINDIAECEILLDKKIPNISYSENSTMGNFILIDKISNLTVGAGIIKHDLRRANNVVWQDTEVSLEKRSEIIGQTPFVLWFTGLSGSGKSTIANAVERKLAHDKKLTFLLDGDNLRHGLNKDIGFKKEDRIENIRRASEVVKLLYESSVIVIAAFISPFQNDRENARKLIPDERFFEIYVEASIEELMKRDPKGLYKKAKEGKIPNFTGLDSEYEVPLKPDIQINTEKTSPEEAVDMIIKYLKEKNAY